MSYVKSSMITVEKSTRNKIGRKLDESRNTVILLAALDVLAEEGYDGMTMDAVAARAKAGKGTMYRRWPSKADLVLEAVSMMKQKMVDLSRIPDTGNLRADLLALFKPQSHEQAERTLKIMSGLSSLLLQNQNLSNIVSDIVVGPWADAYRALIKRAIERGEVSKSVDLDTVAQIVPSMAAYRSMILRKPFDKEFLVSMLDSVLLPALGVKAG